MKKIALRKNRMSVKSQCIEGQFIVYSMLLGAKDRRTSRHMVVGDAHVTCSDHIVAERFR